MGWLKKLFGSEESGRDHRLSSYDGPRLINLEASPTDNILKMVDVLHEYSDKAVIEQLMREGLSEPDAKQQVKSVKNLKM